MKTLLIHITRLASFQHKGAGLNWEPFEARQLAGIVFFMPVLIYVMRNGMENAIVYFTSHSGLLAAFIGAFALLFIHLGRRHFIQAEVGLLLLCLAFYLIVFAFGFFSVTLTSGALYGLLLWLIAAAAWYVHASRVKVSVFNK